MRVFVCVCALVVALASCGKPESRLAKHADEVTAIMELNSATPKAGIEQLREWWRDNLPAVAKDFANALVELDRIDNSARRAARANEMLTELRVPIQALQSASEKFGTRVRDDKDSLALLDQIMNEYKATVEALGGAMPDSPMAKYERRAKATEAIDQIDKMYKASSTYYSTPMVEKGTGARIDCQFPESVAVTAGPGNLHPCCNPEFDRDGDHRCDVNSETWTDRTWAALNFGMYDQHYFAYAYSSAGTLADAKFTATAYADQDCDGIWSTFERYGYGDAAATRSECSMKGSSAFFKENEAE